jgi:hypothetical protein
MVHLGQLKLMTISALPAAKLHNSWASAASSKHICKGKKIE